MVEGERPEVTRGAAEAVHPLSVASKRGSALEHQAAEQSSFVTELLAGRVNRDGYQALFDELGAELARFRR